MPTSNIHLSLNFSQVFDLVKQLSAKDKQKLIGLLKEEAEQQVDIPEAHKAVVRERIKKYATRPDELVDWSKAQKLIGR